MNRCESLLEESLKREEALRKKVGRRETQLKIFACQNMKLKEALKIIRSKCKTFEYSEIVTIINETLT